METLVSNLVIFDVHTLSPKLYWNGQYLPTRKIIVLAGKLSLHFAKGSVDKEILNALRALGIRCKEVK